MAISVRVDISGAIRKLQELPAKLQDKAISAALNKTASSARTDMKRQISAEFDIKSSTVLDALTITKASPKATLIQAILSAKGKRNRGINADNPDFGVRVILGSYLKRTRAGNWKQVTSKDGGGVSFKISKRGRKTVKSAFIHPKSSQHSVWQRIGQSGNIRPLVTIATPGMFKTRRIYDRVLENTRQQFILETDRQIKRFSGR